MSRTFRPPLRCKANPELDAHYIDDVMKVPHTTQGALREFENELSVSSMIRDLDPDRRYFLPLSQDSCELESGQTGYFLPYGGNTMTTALETATPEDAWNWLRHLLEAIQLLETVSFKHGDLTLQNIVIDPVGLLPRIIDFGVARVLSEYYDADVRNLFYDYNRTVLPLLRQRFPSSERLVHLQEILNNYRRHPVTITELLRQFDE